MQSVISVRFIESRSQLISLSKDKVLRIWDTHLQVCLQRLSGMFPKGPAEVSITMYYDEEHCKLFTAFNHQLTLMVMKPEVKDRIMSHEHPVTAAIYNSKFNQVVSACTGSVITMWMIETGQKVKQFANAHGSSEITTLAQDATETRLFTASADGTVKIWDFNGHCHHILMAGNGDPAEISQVLCLKRIIIVVGWDRTISVFRDTQLNSFYVYPSEWKGRLEHQDDVLSEAFCPPTTLATASYDGDIVLWNLNSEQAFRHLSTHAKRKPTRSSRRSRRAQDTSTPTQRPVETETLLKPPQTGDRSASATSVTATEEPRSEDDFGYAVTKLIFLNERPMSASSAGANLVSCNASGWVRFWNTHKTLCVGQFLAHEHAGFLTMTVDDTNSYLVTGDADGVIKVWDIAEYCVGNMVNNDTPPPLFKQFQPHTDTINSIQLFSRSERLLVLTASSDCAVALWDIEGRHIGIFGQEEHWKIEPISKEEREAEQAKQAEQEQSDNSDDDEQPEEDAGAEEPNLFTDDKFDPSFRVRTWEQTILGKAYQEKRIEKRERRQPQVIPDLPYLNWEKTGQAPAGPYASLDTTDLQEVGGIQKPDFIAHPERYFSESSAGKRSKGVLPSVPNVTENLQMRYDEKSLFPKYILEMEAKMKAAHALGIRTSRGARARGDSSQTKPRASHEGTQLNNKRVASWRVLLTSKGKDP